MIDIVLKKNCGVSESGGKKKDFSICRYPDHERQTHASDTMVREVVNPFLALPRDFVSMLRKIGIET